MPASNAQALVSVRTTTTDGTITTGATHRTKAGYAYIVTLYAVATDGTVTQSYVRIATFEHSAAGTLSLIGSVTSVHTAEDLAAPGDCTMDADDTNKDIRVRIAGNPGSPLKWSLALDVVTTPN